MIDETKISVKALSIPELRNHSRSCASLAQDGPTWCQGKYRSRLRECNDELRYRGAHDTGKELHA